MDERTDPAPQGTGGFCHFHGGDSGTALPVKSVIRNSGPDVLLYACAPCREQRRLTPLRGTVA
ncbi:hypothetical protein [Streptomyces xantholiticus]|uniref:hypothetical protein n=1 Tax=Streptomyces xantholiticus TaxID=68285 RepID=UPI0016774039|nr:hypothetical protein [Streptomyces xantholiticus]